MFKRKSNFIDEKIMEISRTKSRLDELLNIDNQWVKKKCSGSQNKGQTFTYNFC